MRVERGCTLMPCWNGMYCVVCSGSPGSSSGVQRCLCRLLCSRSTVLYSAVHHSIPQSITAYFRTRARLGLWYSWLISLYGLLQHKTCLVEMPRQRHPRSRLSHVSYHPRVRALLFGPRAIVLRRRMTSSVIQTGRPWSTNYEVPLPLFKAGALGRTQLSPSCVWSVGYASVNPR